ncbi:MAG: RHS repeat-associated core domain-containing protein [Armatimonadota bacterium]
MQSYGAVQWTVEYIYDPMGNLVKRTQGTSTIAYTVDIAAGLPVVLIEDDGTTVTKYTYGDDLLKVSRSGEYYYFYDGLGSTRTITDSTGTPVAQYVYDPYGKLSTESVDGATWNSFLFTGQMLDRTTGLYYLRARWYDPQTGRFVSRDTFEGTKLKPLSLHRYSYCASSPVDLIDPTGRDSLGEVITSTGMMTFLYANAFTIINVSGFVGEMVLGDALPPGMSLVPGVALGQGVRVIGKEVTEEVSEGLLRSLIKIPKYSSGWWKVFEDWFPKVPKTVGEQVVELHHVIPQEWRKVMGSNVVDVLGNLRPILRENHYIISKEWNAWKRSLGDVVPSPRDIILKMQEIDAKYGHLFLPIE